MNTIETRVLNLVESSLVSPHGMAGETGCGHVYEPETVRTASRATACQVAQPPAPALLPIDPGLTSEAPCLSSLASYPELSSANGTPGVWVASTMTVSITASSMQSSLLSSAWQSQLSWAGRFSDADFGCCRFHTADTTNLNHPASRWHHDPCSESRQGRTVIRTIGGHIAVGGMLTVLLAGCMPTTAPPEVTGLEVSRRGRHSGEDCQAGC